MGRAIYGGVFEPASPLADGAGYRRDVTTALRRLDMTVMRYPGGNFASGYHWRDGIGPRDQRPAVHELAWNSTEPNRFGTDEFIGLCRTMGWAPMITVNLGTGTPEEARDWVEYCNGRPGTVNADLREKGGAESAYGVPLWCLGNEMDGSWQIGHVPAGEYALRAQQAARMMKAVDGSIELVACGSCGISLPTYMEWDLTVLDYLGELADFVSLHRYVGNPDSDLADYLAVTNSVDRQIEEMDAACRYVQAKHRSDRRAYLCFDEWNVWYKNRDTDGGGEVGPSLVEEVYNLEDALVVAGFLNSFIRHADVVRIANLAQIVNVIAPLVTHGERLLVQSTFYPFEMVSRRRRGTSLRPVVSGPTYVGKTNGRVHLVDTSAIVDGERLHVFLLHRNDREDGLVRLQVGDHQITGIESAEVLTGPGPKAENTLADPELVSTRQFLAAEVHRGTAVLRLPPLSVTALTFVLN
jgi:alpha-N-arabinofuranosidase